MEDEETRRFAEAIREEVGLFMHSLQIEWARWRYVAPDNFECSLRSWSHLALQIGSPPGRPSPGALYIID